MKVRAVQIDRVGGPEVLELAEIEVGEPGPGEVRIRHEAIDTWDRSLDCLQPFGLMVSFGNASGPPPLVDLGQLMRKGSLYVTRPTMATHILKRAQVEELAAALFAQISSGAVKIGEPRTYPLADAARAHTDLEARATTGSSVLVP